jgi:hypothetical protein
LDFNPDAGDRVVISRADYAGITSADLAHGVRFDTDVSGHISDGYRGFTYDVANSTLYFDQRSTWHCYR